MDSKYIAHFSHAIFKQVYTETLLPRETSVFVEYMIFFISSYDF